MAFSLGGLASGIDTNSLVDGLMNVARQPVDALTKKKAEVDAASQTISSISTKLSALKNAALALSTMVGFSSFTASSSDAAIVASATGAATSASYSVNVTNLARAQKTRSQTFASATTALGTAGSLEIKVGSANAVNVTIGAGDTLADVAAKISSSGARVSASILNTGTTSRLIVQGLETGTDNAFTITETGVSLGLSASGAKYEDALDATLTVDNMLITSKTNQITGVIAGVKLALTKTTTSPATIQVSSDPATLKTKITTFVNAYNDFVNTGHSAAGFGGTKAVNPTLAADSAVRTALNRVGFLMASAVPNTSGPYRTFASIGITGRRDGTLAFDAAKLETALAADPSSVRRLFVTDTATGATGLMSTVMSTVDGLITGESAPIQARMSALGARSKRLADAATKMETRLNDYETQLKKQFANMDTLVGKYQSMQSAVTSISNLGTNNSSNQ
ncbi:MAG: flagellar filament capping protein FliD [Deltaproteobacteria bacterium]|nr:flagellar filament capping protein FliD [Deltaproteobacteria bacterium]